MISLSNISFDCSHRLPGLKKIFVARVSDIIAIPKPQEMTITAAITMRLGKRFKEIEFTDDTAEFNDVMQINEENGEFYQKTVKIFHAFQEADKDYNLSIMNEGIFILLIKDWQDVWQVVGTLENPLRLKVDSDTGRGNSGVNGYSITFSGTGKKKSPFAYTAQIDPIIFENAHQVFSSGFSRGFLKVRYT